MNDNTNKDNNFDNTDENEEQSFFNSFDTNESFEREINSLVSEYQQSGFPSENKVYSNKKYTKRDKYVYERIRDAFEKQAFVKYNNELEFIFPTEGKLNTLILQISEEPKIFFIKDKEDCYSMLISIIFVPVAMVEIIQKFLSVVVTKQIYKDFQYIEYGDFITIFHKVEINKFDIMFPKRIVDKFAEAQLFNTLFLSNRLNEFLAELSIEGLDFLDDDEETSI